MPESESVRLWTHKITKQMCCCFQDFMQSFIGQFVVWWVCALLPVGLLSQLALHYNMAWLLAVHLCILIPNGEEPITGQAAGHFEITAIFTVAALNAGILRRIHRKSHGSRRQCETKASALAKFQTVREAQLLFSAALFRRRPPRTLNEQLISRKPH